MIQNNHIANLRKGNDSLDVDDGFRHTPEYEEGIQAKNDVWIRNLEGAFQKASQKRSQFGVI